MDDAIRFEEYLGSRAEAVAAMWRESREGWPPGFMGASVFTPESVESEERASGSLFTILALCGERVVGLCRTTPWGGEPDAAYVGLLTVVPDLHGKKIGRDLLLDAIGRSASLGYRRIDLNTWPANMKAMPLYKKTGFFWVPDTQVYMQNYMPFLIGRPEMTDFLDGTGWYGCFERELSIQPDEEKTPSGREVFTYLFRRRDATLRAVFDRRGRMLSSLTAPGIDISVERESGPVWFSRPAWVTVSGTSLPAGGRITTDPDLSTPMSRLAGETSVRFPVTPMPVDVPTMERDRSPRVILSIPAEKPLEIGLGLRAEEPVSLASPPVLWAPPGRTVLGLDLIRPSDLREVRILASLDGSRYLDRVFRLENAVFQRLEIPLPEGGLPAGLSRLALVLESEGLPGVEESIVLVSGGSVKPAGWTLTRGYATAVAGRLAVSVSRRGLEVDLLAPDSRLETAVVGSLQVQAGPPYWNSDLPHQLYRMTASDEWLTAVADWPSRRGLTHVCRLRMDPAGFLETVSSLENASDAEQSAHFSCGWDGGTWFHPATCHYPLGKGLFSCPEVDNQVPDIEEDLPKLTDGLSSPWLGRTQGGRSLMVSFPGWPELRYDRPESGELRIPAGSSVETPPLRLLSVTGSIEDLLAAARSLGWATGTPDGPSDFMDHNLRPVMAEGALLRLSHNLLGLRSAAISLDGETLTEGDAKSGIGISAAASGTGTKQVSLDLAGREFVFPVHFISAEEPPVEVRREDGDLLLGNGRMTVRVAPSGFGHVYSVRLDGVEYLMSAHPGPSVFEWESPWYGGIHPRIIGDWGALFRLDWHEPMIEPLEETEAGLRRAGWMLSWTVDHKRFGSYRIQWSVSMLPLAPILRTAFRIEPLAGCCAGQDADLRGFLAPGGTAEGSVLTCAASGRLVQGRDHAGAWAPAGGWARVTGGGGQFVEALPSGDGVLWYEDYADGGCHLSLISEVDRRRALSVDWIFGSSADDGDLARIMRAHLPSAGPQT